MANRRPTIDGTDKTSAPGTKIPISGLFDWSDKDGPRDIVSFTLKDGKGGGYLTRDNKAQPEGKSYDIPASEIGRWAYVAGENGSKDTITLKVQDKAKASDTDTATVTAAIPNARPDVDGHDMTKAPGTKIPVASLFDWSDADGTKDIVSFAIKDNPGGGYLTRDGKAQAEGKSFDVPAAEIGRWVYVTGAKGSQDTITLTATDKAKASDSDTARVTAESGAAPGAIQLVSPVAGTATWKVGQAPGGSFSHKGDLYHGWDFSLAGGTDEFGMNVYAVAAGQVKWVVEHVVDGDSVQLDRDPTWGPSGGLGNIVTLEHKENGVTFYSSYFHLKENSVPVSVGDWVAAGQKIGAIGNTGARDGTHLHLNLGTSYGPYTNGEGLSFPAYMIAEGPPSPNLLGKFDFIDSPRADKELHTDTQFVSSTTPASRAAAAERSAAAGEPGFAIDGEDGHLAPELLFPESGSSFAQVSASAFSEAADALVGGHLPQFDQIPDAWYLP